ncbi:MAG: hypothetical protein WB771_07850 [Solirubrobacterales bacterium]
MHGGGKLPLDLAPGILEILAIVANLPRNLVLLSRRALGERVRAERRS